MGMREEGEIIDVEAVPVIAGPTSLPPSMTAGTGTGSESMSVTTEPPKKTVRGRKAKEQPPTPVGEIECKLKEVGYTADELIRVAVTNNWADTTTKSLSEIEEPKLKFFLEKWSDVLAELAEQRKSTKPKSENQPFE